MKKSTDECTTLKSQVDKSKKENEQLTKDIKCAKDEVVKITEASKKGASAVADEDKKQKEAEIKKLND